MNITTISSREFHQAVSAAKRAANQGPVLITEGARPTHVLMSFEDYQKLTMQRRSIADALAMPDISGIEFDPPQAIINAKSADLV